MAHQKLRVVAPEIVELYYSSTIERRNQLTRVRTFLATAVELLQEAANTISEQSSDEERSV